MSNEVSYILIFITSIFISSVSQILLKKSANKTYSNKLKEYFNCNVVVAYILFFASTLITIYAFRYIPLSWGPILESTGYIFVSVLGVIFLKEKIAGRKLLGMIIIVFGIIVCSLGSLPQ